MRRKLWTLPWSCGGRAARVIRTETGMGGRGGWAVHSAQRGGDSPRELESVRGAVCSSGEGRMGRMQLQVVLQRIVPPAAQPLNPDAPLSSFSLLFSPSAAASWVRTAGLLVRMFPPHSCAVTCLLLSSNGNKLLNTYVYFKEGDVSGCTHT